MQSEGAGVLILEEWDHATSRGADVLAELLAQEALLMLIT